MFSNSFVLVRSMLPALLVSLVISAGCSNSPKAAPQEKKKEETSSTTTPPKKTAETDDEDSEGATNNDFFFGTGSSSTTNGGSNTGSTTLGGGLNPAATPSEPVNNGTTTGVDFSTLRVQSSQILSNAVLSSHIADGQVGVAKLQPAMGMPVGTQIVWNGTAWVFSVPEGTTAPVTVAPVLRPEPEIQLTEYRADGSTLIRSDLSNAAKDEICGGVFGASYRAGGLKDLLFNLRPIIFQNKESRYVVHGHDRAFIQPKGLTSIQYDYQIKEGALICVSQKNALQFTRAALAKTSSVEDRNNACEVEFNKEGMEYQVAAQTDFAANMRGGVAFKPISGKADECRECRQFLDAAVTTFPLEASISTALTLEIRITTATTQQTDGRAPVACLRRR